jgi:hypothetical protein
MKRSHKLPDVAHRLGFELHKSGESLQQFFILCPFHNERTASCCLSDSGFNCFGCGAHGDAIKLIRQARGCSFQDAIEWLNGGSMMPIRQESRTSNKDHSERMRQQAEKTWNEASAFPEKSPCFEAGPGLKQRVQDWMDSRSGELRVLSYFVERKIRPSTVISSRSIRFHPALWHSETQQTHPAVVFRLETFSTDDGESESPQPDAMPGIHRVYLNDDCNGKLQGATAKKLLGSPNGAGIWFDPPAEIVFVAEGPEDALAVREAFGFPTVCGIASNLLAKLILSPCVRELHIFPDPDAAGQKAANTLAARAEAQHIKTFIYDWSANVAA